MGEAKRRRLNESGQSLPVVGAVLGTFQDKDTGASQPLRRAGRLRDYLETVRLLGEQPDQIDSSHVPCNDCTACCYHAGVDLEPSMERPADLAHLDLETHADGRTFLRKKADGACVHLGPNGCTVYAHRPRACRAYDCRYFSMIRMLDHFDGERFSPLWYFDLKTPRERAIFLALTLAGRAYSRQTGCFVARDVLAAACATYKRFFHCARTIVEEFDRMTPAQQRAIGLSAIPEFDPNYKPGQPIKGEIRSEISTVERGECEACAAPEAEDDR
jgi:Fe-S-cluster containining protein